MSSLAVRPQAEEERDNLGAGAAAVAAEALIAAAEHVMSLGTESLAGAGSLALLVGLQVRLNEATVAAERLYDRQLSAALIREIGYVAGYMAGLAARDLRPVR